VGDGGLAVALAECCEGGIGADIEIETELRPEFALFHEGPSRAIVSTEKPEAVERIARRHGIRCAGIGVTMKARLRIGSHSDVWVDSPVAPLRETWENALEDLLSVAHV
jgi:phosphoribosylformylglycinamidine synthase